MVEENDNQPGSDNEDFRSFASPEMDNVFKKNFYLEREEAVTLRKNYILHMAATSLGPETNLALGLSTYETSVYSVGASVECINTLPAMGSHLVNVKFSPDNPFLLYVGCNRGVIKLWDLRDTKQCAQLFKETSESKGENFHGKKNFCSFDVNRTGRFVCAGTEVSDGDAYLLFWDSRQASLLGGYWECHTDDITQVSFHPSEQDHLITGSTDGLINLYDISQADENEALLQSYNTESSVDKLKWHEGTTMTVSCVTHTADVQLWHLQDSSPYSSYSRASIAKTLQMDSDLVTNSLYMGDVHSTSQSETFMILAGSNFGNGRCLRSATVALGKISPQSYFEGNKQIVRCSWFDPQNELLVTAGEAGILSVWKSGSGGNVSSPNQQLKATSKFKNKPHKSKSKPY